MYLFKTVSKVKKKNHFSIKYYLFQNVFDTFWKYSKFK